MNKIKRSYCTQLKNWGVLVFTAFKLSVAFLFCSVFYLCHHIARRDTLGCSDALLAT